ncbi:4Fe-4S binding protein [Myxococcota bacterium]|nr:4Fe-4S binding protein [Myxococcota bacterium]MBU1380427.1 4Fe-4S binding protein [Myxococcota bacterium]MBU1498359.1 4Fe-4S binding protein [Myxococcota bacterium]
MNTSEIDPTGIYRQLQKHLDQYPIGFPATDTGVELRLLKYFFTHEEAQVVLCLGLVHNSVKRIRRRFLRRHKIEISEEKLSEICNVLFMDGSIRRSDKAPYGYSIAFLAIGMFEFHVDSLSAELMSLMHEYFEAGFKDEFFTGALPQLRTSPHMKAIVPEHRIDIYDNMRRYVEETDQVIGVANCVCKQGEALLGSPCKQVDDIEICIFFGEGNYLDRNRGRVISKAECLELLDTAEKRGLVIQPGNSLQAFCICLCCGCCCGVLTAAKKFEKPARMFATNYYARLDPELCNGCGVCIKRCQMDALQLSGEKPLRRAVLDLDRCIGCGLCITTCKPGALKLGKKEKVTVPPRNIEMLYLSILARKAGKGKMILNLLRLGLGMPL